MKSLQQIVYNKHICINTPSLQTLIFDKNFQAIHQSTTILTEVMLHYGRFDIKLQPQKTGPQKLPLNHPFHHVPSCQQEQFVNDGQRYTVAIADHFHEGSHVIYVLSIIDQCFANSQYQLCFRYKTIKKVHENLLKDQRLRALGVIPQFPKTKSFLFLNQTNRNQKNIQDRARQLEYYIHKLLNNCCLAKTLQVKLLLKKAKKSVINGKRRTKSQEKIKINIDDSQSNKSINSESQSLYQLDTSKDSKKNHNEKGSKKRRNSEGKSLGKPLKTATGKNSLQVKTMMLKSRIQYL